MENQNLKNNISLDVERFSKLHKWSDQLPFDGIEFLIYPFKGQEPKNFHDHCVNDHEQMHWWIQYASFIDELPLHFRAKEIVMQHRFKLNCFLSPLEEGHVRGWGTMKRKNPHMEKMLKRRYPEAKDINTYAVLERTLQIESAKTAAYNIYNYLLAECPEILYPYDPLDPLLFEDKDDINNKKELVCERNSTFSQEELLLNTDRTSIGDGEEKNISPKCICDEKVSQGLNFERKKNVRGSPVFKKRLNSSPGNLGSERIVSPRSSKRENCKGKSLRITKKRELPEKTSSKFSLKGDCSNISNEESGQTYNGTMQYSPLAGGIFSPRDSSLEIFQRNDESPKGSPASDGLSPRSSPLKKSPLIRERGGTPPPGILRKRHNYSNGSSLKKESSKQKRLYTKK